MKELIDKLYLGIIEYEVPQPQVSITEIRDKVHAARVIDGSFEIVSLNNVPLKGIVHSTNENIKILGRDFIGTKATINYQINTMYLKKNDSIEGYINIVSNGGEIQIPVELEVGKSSADTTIGNVKNMFHFTNLVQTSYDEALKLFLSPRFKDVFLKDDLKLLSIYEGLADSVNKDLALEEFLLAANKKAPVTIRVVDTEKKYHKPEESFSDYIIISKNNWGYTKLDVEVSGDFIKCDKKSLSSFDFAGSNYEYNYVIDVDKLHGGNNFGRITFRNYSMEASVDIIISCGDEKNSLDIKKYTLELERTYLEFRLRKITGHIWQEKSLELIKRIRNISDDSIFIKLFQAQLFITKGMESEASWLLENVAEQLIEKRNENVELYCYYLYVRTLERRDPEFTNEMLKKIKQYYSEGHDDWRILWTLLYLDESYDNNVTLKLLRIKEQYARGMRTPLMYFEAMCVFNEHPEYLRIFNDFEVQVLLWGAKNQAINKYLEKQIADLIASEKKFNKKIFRVLEMVYEKNKTPLMLEALIRMLIRGNKIDKKYFYWYSHAVEKGLKVTGLYEYFVQTMPEDYSEVVPQVILMYFTYNDPNTDNSLSLGGSISAKRMSILYKNIIEHRDEVPNIYNMYEKQIELFAIEGILSGKIDENFSIIYESVLKNAMINSDIAAKLPAIINTYMVQCKSDYIREILVVHKELKKIDRIPVIGNKAYMTIYTENATIVYVDLFGNRYIGEEHGTVKKLLSLDEFMQLCFELTVNDDGMLLYFCDKYLNYGKNNGNSVEILKFVSKLENVKDEYRILLEKEIVNYYEMNYDGDVIDSYLETVDAEKLEKASKIKIIELMIVRGLYDRAFEFMSRYGFSDVVPGRIMKCCSKLIEKREFEYNEKLVQMSVFAYGKGKYNEVILKYISEHYYGTTKEMLDIWKNCESFECVDRDFFEKIISQIMFTGECMGSLAKVFDKYCKYGSNYKVKKAVLVSRAYDYFIGEKLIDEIFFEYISKEIDDNEELIDICRIAYTKFCSEKDTISEYEAEKCRKIIYEMCEKGKRFDFFKSFKNYFELPLCLMDNYIVEYRTTPHNKVFIHYIVEKGDLDEKRYTVKEMNEVSQGIYTFEYVLFYGENFKYYISEEGTGNKIISESKNIYIGEKDDSFDDVRFGMINNMMLCREMGEDTTLKEIAEQFYKHMQLGKEIFEIK